MILSVKLQYETKGQIAGNLIANEKDSTKAWITINDLILELSPLQLGLLHSLISKMLDTKNSRHAFDY